MDDPRNGLFPEIVLLFDTVQPRIFVVENVSGLVKKMRAVFAEILRKFAALVQGSCTDQQWPGKASGRPADTLLIAADATSGRALVEAGRGRGRTPPRTTPSGGTLEFITSLGGASPRLPGPG